MLLVLLLLLQFEFTSKFVIIIKSIIFLEPLVELETLKR